MGVYGMLAIGFFMFIARHFIPPDRGSERAMKLSFWGLNVGLGLMLCANLIPMGGIQLYDAVQNGYWHARQPEFFQQPWPRISLPPRRSAAVRPSSRSGSGSGA